MAVVTLCLAAVLSVAGQQEVVGAARVAAVSVPAVSEQYLRTADLEAHFESLRRGFNERRETLRSKLERTARSLEEELKPGTDEFRERTKQLALLEAELQWFTEAEGRKIERGMANSLRSIFEDIQAVIREIAQERSIDVVLACDKMPGEVPDSSTLVRQRILLQKVLYWSPRIDLTQEVVVRLNAKYKARGSASPAGSAGRGRLDETVGARANPSQPEAGQQQ